ncbi:zinc-binding dehydrogenase [Pilimelia columellifera]|uniref:Zinc-binding dehydrogenase n=1 Tax=Pilimelia columellifera subsp. columellifera TaxID=706583 RepID=A0ABN3N6Z8_9ACTN
MRAAYASAIKPDDPLAALTVGERPEPVLPTDDWVSVEVRASALNHHDLWSLRGVGLRAEQLPMILGCDAAGIDPDGNEVVVHAVIDDPTDQRGYSLLSERHQGALADRVAVPRGNLVVKPAGFSFAEAACLPTAWLTAWRMLTTRGRVADGESVLVQGAGGGVATAAVALGVAMGKRVYATSRSAAKRERVSELGATAVAPGVRLPERVDVVIETVGEATFDHSMKSAAPGARIVVAGCTSGPTPPVDLRRVFWLQLEILGSTMGSANELQSLLAFLTSSGLRPVIDSAHGFTEAEQAFARLASGEAFGKVVIDHTR